jgi:uncharacterized NAD(P)/FAD-binding protein YdhS
MRKKFRIAVIGGGASGALLILQLVRSRRNDVEIILFEPSPDLGRGKAYEKNSEILLLNTSAEKMSIWEEEPQHFLEWIQNNCKDLLQSENFPFLPRSVFGDYLQSNLETFSNAFRKLPFAVNSLKIGKEKKVEVHYFGKTELFDFCCVSTGYGKYIPSNEIERISFTAKQFPHELNILGSGLSAIDMWMLLRGNGYEGAIHFFSRSGHFPLAHEFSSSRVPDFRFAVGGSPRELLRFFQNGLEKDGHSPPALADAFRKVANEIWAAWGQKEKKSFLKHLRSRWQKVRHRVPPKIHELLRRELIDGKISIQKVSKEFEFGVAKRKDFFRSTGFASHGSPFLYDSSLIKPSAFGLGLESKQENLEVLGPTRMGKDWESSSIPEIRQTATEIAKKWIGKMEKSHPAETRWLQENSI